MVDQTLQQLTLGERMKAYEDKETKLRLTVFNLSMLVLMAVLLVNLLKA